MCAIEKETARLIQSVVRRSGWIELPAEGDSMYPFIRQGDLCCFVSCDPFSLKRGDVVLFSLSTGRLVAHRFNQADTFRHRTLFFFKGDTNLGFDEPIREEQIIGKLEFVQKGLFKIKARFFLAFLWGRLVLSLPFLSGWLRRFLNWKHRTG